MRKIIKVAPNIAPLRRSIGAGSAQEDEASAFGLATDSRKERLADGVVVIADSPKLKEITSRK
jgi:hypothetical protein